MGTLYSLFDTPFESVPHTEIRLSSRELSVKPLSVGREPEYILLGKSSDVFLSLQIGGLFSILRTKDDVAFDVVESSEPSAWVHLAGLAPSGSIGWLPFGRDIGNLVCQLLRLGIVDVNAVCGVDPEVFALHIKVDRLRIGG